MVAGSRSPGKGNRDAAGYAYVLVSAICFALAGMLIKSIDWNALSISGARLRAGARDAMVVGQVEALAEIGEPLVERNVGSFDRRI